MKAMKIILITFESLYKCDTHKAGSYVGEIMVMVIKMKIVLTIKRILITYESLYKFDTHKAGSYVGESMVMMMTGMTIRMAAKRIVKKIIFVQM